QKIKRKITGTKYIFKYTPCLLYLLALGRSGPGTFSRMLCILIGKTTELRVGCYGCRRMPRHFYFRDDGNIPFSRILDYLFYFFLCIIATMLQAVVSFTGIAANDGAISPATYFSESWIFFYLNPPALVICKVPVKNIEFV